MCAYADPKPQSKPNIPNRAHSLQRKALEGTALQGTALQGAAVQTTEVATEAMKGHKHWSEWTYVPVLSEHRMVMPASSSMADRRATMTLDSARRRDPTARVDVHTISMAMGMEATWDTSSMNTDAATTTGAHAQQQHRARTHRQWAELHRSRQAPVQRPLPMPHVDTQK